MRAKVLVVIPDSSLGGITTSAVNFVKEISKNDYVVDVLVMDGTMLPSPLNCSYIRLNGMSKYWKLGVDNIKSSKPILWPFLLFLAIIKKILIRCGLWYPFIFTNYKINGYDLGIGYRQSEPCYYFIHKCVNARRKVALIHGNYNYMKDTSTWDYLLPQFDNVACVSNAVSLDFKKAFPKISDKFVTLYNMFDVEGILKKADESCDYITDNTKTNIISVARHDNVHKRINRIPEAVALLIDRGYKNFHWYIVGDGPDFDVNVSLAKSLNVADYITFCGAMANPFPLQKECDFSVMTSLTEAYSMSVIESLIMGKPVVVMRYPGIEEAIIDGTNGMIADQTIEGLVMKMELLLKDYNMLCNLKKNICSQQITNAKSLQQFEMLL